MAMARRFRRAGMFVVLGDVEQSALDAAVDDLGVGTVGAVCDVTSPASMDALRDVALEAFGDVHVVCLNAGVAPVGPLLETELDTWRWVIDVNVLGVVHGIRSFAPLLVDAGPRPHRVHLVGRRLVHHSGDRCVLRDQTRRGRHRHHAAGRARPVWRRRVGDLPGSAPDADLRKRAEPARSAFGDAVCVRRDGFALSTSGGQRARPLGCRRGRLPGASWKIACSCSRAPK